MAALSSPVQTYLQLIEGTPLYWFIKTSVGLYGYHLTDITEILIQPQEIFNNQNTYTLTFRDKQSIRLYPSKWIESLDKTQHL